MSETSHPMFKLQEAWSGKITELNEWSFKANMFPASGPVKQGGEGTNFTFQKSEVPEDMRERLVLEATLRWRQSKQVGANVYVDVLEVGPPSPEQITVNENDRSNLTEWMPVPPLPRFILPPK